MSLVDRVRALLGDDAVDVAATRDVHSVVTEQGDRKSTRLNSSH